MRKLSILLPTIAALIFCGASHAAFIEDMHPAPDITSSMPALDIKKYKDADVFPEGHVNVVLPDWLIEPVCEPYVAGFKFCLDGETQALKPRTFIDTDTDTDIYLFRDQALIDPSVGDVVSKDSIIYRNIWLCGDDPSVCDVASKDSIIYRNIWLCGDDPSVCDVASKDSIIYRNIWLCGDFPDLDGIGKTSIQNGASKIPTFPDASKAVSGLR